MIRDVDTVVEELGIEVAVEHFEVDALLQRLVAGGIEDGIDHLVEEGLLVDVAALHHLLHRLVGLRDGALVLAQNHCLRHLRGLGLNGLQHERRVDGAVLPYDRVLVALLEGAVGLTRAGAHRVDAIGTALGLVDVLFEVAPRLVQLQVAAGLIECAVYRLVELLLLHLSHLADVLQLKEEQGEKRCAHDDCYNPNRSFVHGCKGSENLKTLPHLC